MYQPAKRPDLQDRERPDRVPALPTVRPRDQMPPNMGSHAEPNISDNDSNIKISRMVQDIEVVEHHMVCSSYAGLHEQAPASTRSTGRIVVHTPLQNQGVQPQRLRRYILWWPKLQEYRRRGESMQVFSWQESSYLTMSTWRPQYRTARPLRMPTEPTIKIEGHRPVELQPCSGVP